MQKFVIETKSGNSVELDTSIFEVDNKNSMVNLTKMAKSCGREVYKWWELDSSKALVESIAKRMGVVPSDIWRTLQGNYSDGREQGTWAHRKVAIAFAMWISPDFQAWCIDILDQLFQTGYSWEDIKRITEAKDRLANFKIMRMEEKYILNISKTLDLPKSETIEKLNNLYLMYGYNNLVIKQCK